MVSAREKGFWSIDRLLRDGAVAKEVARVKQSQRTPFADLQRELVDVLDFAVREVPFYADCDPRGGLASFPVINKSTVRTAGADSFGPLAYSNKSHVASTSGSTGTPFRVYHDAFKRKRIAADAIYWGGQAGYALGMPLFHVKVWSKRNRIPLLTRMARNIHPLDVTQCDAGRLAELILAAASGRRDVAIISYGSALEDVARLLDRDHSVRGTKSSSIRSMVSQSEALSEEARAVLQRVLGVLPLGRYGLEELGIVAQQLPGSAGMYRVNAGSVHVEILKEDADRPADPGELGRIVVTDKVNRAQPLIRYDTGDLGSFAVTEGEVDPRWLARIDGRVADRIYDTADRPLPNMFMYRIWWKYPEIMQYQMVQHDRGVYEARLRVAASSFKEASFIRDVKGLVGPSANVAVTYTDEEFVLTSGKRRILVNHYRPTPSESKG